MEVVRRQAASGREAVAAAGLLGALFVATAVLAAVGPGGSPGRSMTGPSNLATESSSSTSGCHEGQLQAELKGIQGAAGNWAAAFWVADTSPEDCTLPSPVQVDLMGSSGQVELRGIESFTPVLLSGGGSIPAGDANPTGRLAFVTLFWPTDADAALAMGSSDGHCPTADFVPDAVRLEFGNSVSVATDNPKTDDRQIAICGKPIIVPDVGLLPPG